MKNKLKYLAALITLVVLVAATAVHASAEEGANAAVTAAETDEENFFTAVYEEISAYTSEILCAMTLAGSLALAFAYKKGLLPLVERSLVTIGNAVTKIKENTNETAQKSSEIGESIDQRLLAAHELLDSLAKRIDSLDGSLKASLENESRARIESKQLKLVVDAQIDMLYDVFMSSALPQYQKDAVGERIAKMKEAVAQNADEK